MNKTTFLATCPVTGETAKRTSSHPYTHALTVKKTAQYKLDESRPSVIVRSRGQSIPAGYLRTRQPGSNVYGSDVPGLPLPASEQKTVVVSLVSFHESAELARKAAKAYELGGWNVVEAIAVPCTVKGA